MEKLGKILIIDDNKDVLFALNLLLEPLAEKVKVMLSPDRIAYFMDSFRPDLILLDMNFRRDAISGQEGMDCLQRILELDKRAVVILMTAYSDVDKAVSAIKAGATDFIGKPWEREKLLATLSSAMKLRRSQNDVSRLEEQVEILSENHEEEPLPEWIGQSEPMRDIAALTERLGQTEANILLLGENGTGKDVLARRLHALSQRKKGPFVAIDLGSLSEGLFESELFGYEKGAFTDARQMKKGRMEMACGGTLFLNEIGNLSPALQAKLLTAIERRCITRLGATREIPIDVRLICATNADLHAEVAGGDFRQDLLYRINTVEIHLPPLRERGEDIDLLAEHFLKIYARKYHKNIRSIQPAALAKLRRYAWPGNVRELSHAVERAVILSDGPVLYAEGFALQPSSSSCKDEGGGLNLEVLERNAIRSALRQAGGNMTRAAELLGITRFALYRKMEKFGL